MSLAEMNAHCVANDAIEGLKMLTIYIAAASQSPLLKHLLVPWLNIQSAQWKIAGGAASWNHFASCRSKDLRLVQNHVGEKAKCWFDQNQCCQRVVVGSSYNHCIILASINILLYH
jgi:hypothetical protein